MHEAAIIALFKHLIRGGKTGGEVPVVGHHRCRVVVHIKAQIPFRPNAWRIGRQGRFGFQDKGEQLVVDRNQRQGLLSDVPIGGRDRSDRITHATHRIVKDIAPLPCDLLDGIVVLTSTGHRTRPPDHLGILVGNHGPHAG